MKYIFTFLLFLTSLNIYSQFNDNDLTIIGVKGLVNTKHKTSIKVGDKLSNNDTLHLFSNSYVGLVNRYGMTYELTKRGSYPLKIYSLKKTKKSINNRFYSFIVDEAVKDNTYTKHEHMNRVGSVYRAVEDVVFEVNEFSNDVILNNKLIFTIKIKDTTIIKTPKFQVRIFTLFNDLLFDTIISDTTVYLDLTKINKYDNYLISVNCYNCPETYNYDFALKRKNNPILTKYKNKLDFNNDFDCFVYSKQLYMYGYYYESLYYINRAYLLKPLSMYKDYMFILNK